MSPDIVRAMSLDLFFDYLEPYFARTPSSAFQSNSTPWPGPVRRDGAARPDPQRLGDEALEAEAVRLEVRAIGHGGQQVHGEVVGAVRGHRQVERLGQVADLHEDASRRRSS